MTSRPALAPDLTALLMQMRDDQNLVLAEIRALREAFDRSQSALPLPQDASNEDLVRTIDQTTGDREFTGGDLVDHSLLLPCSALAVAIGQANAVSLGIRLASLEGYCVDGLTLVKVREGRDGNVWRLRGL